MLRQERRIQREVRGVAYAYYEKRGWDIEKGIPTRRKLMGLGLSFNVAANSLWGISVMKAGVSTLYNIQGQIDLAYQTVTEAVSIAEESGDTYSKGYAYKSYGLTCFSKGFLEEAVEYLSEAIAMWERLDMFSMAADTYMGLGKTYFAIGEYKKSQDCYDKGTRLFERARHGPSHRYVCRIAFAMAKVAKGEGEVDLAELYNCADGNRYRIFNGRLARYISYILIHVDDRHMNEAEDLIEKAIEASRVHGMMWELGRSHAVYAELLKRKGDLAGAKGQLNKAIEILKECGDDGWVKKYEEELARR